MKSNIITAVDVGLGGLKSGADTTQFVPLAMRTHDNGFQIQHMTADKAYISHYNVDYIDSIGGAAYIPFKDNQVTKPPYYFDTAYDRLKRLFIMDKEAFMVRYHQRSNVETTFFMLKSKFGDLIRSNNETAQINEVLLKCLCHNICCLITAVAEFGVPLNL